MNPLSLLITFLSVFTFDFSTLSCAATALALVIEEKHCFAETSDTENTGIGSIFQRVRNKATVGALTGLPSDTENLSLNIDYHQAWVDNLD